MDTKKIFVFSLTFLLSASLLLSQSLVEAAKKEKERRARLKGKKGKVVTNAELRKVKKTAALSVVRTQTPEKTAKAIKIPALKTELSQPTKADEEKFFREKNAVLEKNLEKAKEYVLLLTTRMNGLWQEFNSMDDMTSRETILKEMDETKKKLERAQKEEARAREELQKFLAEARKKGIPPGWLR